MTAVARTVLGDVDATALGITYAHEHLVLDSPMIAAVFPHILLDDSDIAIREVTRCREAGVRTMVDAMPSAGRDITRLAHISRGGGINMIAATGLHHERYYGTGHWTSRVSVDELARLFVDDLEAGIDEFDYTGPYVRRTAHRAGIIKVATGGGALTSRDRLLFEAAAIAHARTGAPVLTHCEHGHGALEQVAALAHRQGHRPRLSPRDRRVGSMAAVRSGGASGGSRHERDRAAHPRAHRVVVGTDGARRDLWIEYGGAPGLAWLATGFVGTLRQLGLGDPELDHLFIGNPSRALALIAR